MRFRIPNIEACISSFVVWEACACGNTIHIAPYYSQSGIVVPVDIPRRHGHRLFLISKIFVWGGHALVRNSHVGLGKRVYEDLTVNSLTPNPTWLFTMPSESTAEGASRSRAINFRQFAYDWNMQGVSRTAASCRSCRRTCLRL